MAYAPESQEERDFLEHYDADRYRHPSVTADILAFTAHGTDLRILLVKRGGYPYKGRYAIPGGFVRIDESAEEAAQRELFEETGIKGITMHQLATYSAVDRDPRTRVISIAYIAMVPETALADAHGGDDATDAKTFSILRHGNGFILVGDDNEIVTEDRLAFDHAHMIDDAINRMVGRLDYTDDAFELLPDESDFTISELRQVFEAISGQHYEASNFHRTFMQRYVDTGKVVVTGDVSHRDGYEPYRGRPATTYAIVHND